MADKIFSLVSDAVRSKGFGVKKASRADVANALQSEGIDIENYNFSMLDGKKDLYIDAYESGDDIFLYKGYGNTQALCHEFIHKWWKKKGNEAYKKKIKEMFPEKWNEISNNEEYSVILEDEMEICGEVLAKSYEEELKDYILEHKDEIKSPDFLNSIGSKMHEKKISQLNVDDITEILAYDLFNGTNWCGGNDVPKTNDKKKKFSFAYGGYGNYTFWF